MGNNNNTNTLLITCLLFYTFIFLNTWLCSCNVNSPKNATCKPSERAALLNFKHNLTYLDEYFSSKWEGKDCCKWSGVECNSTTGHILKLDLSDGGIASLGTEKLESSLAYLLELKQLESLDLSNNNFNYSSIPRFIGSMKQLRYLDLSSASLGGLVPYELGNLTNLRSLNLGGNYFGISLNHLNWISGLKKLHYLNMNGVNMSDAHDWVESLIGPLPNIEELHLSSCGLMTLDKIVHKNFSFPTQLQIHYLDLEDNYLSEEIIGIVQNLTFLEDLNLANNIISTKYDLWGLVHNLCTLKSLNLSKNYFQDDFLRPPPNFSNNSRNRHELEILHISNSSLIGKFHGWIGEYFRTLRSIDLSGNILSGEIPASIEKLPNLYEILLSKNKFTSVASSLRFPSNLEYLYLDNNLLSGEIPTSSFGKLSKLQELDISSNALEGTILCEAHFANLSSLTLLNLEDALLTLNLSSDWVPPFQLEYFNADNCKINGQLPMWIQTQKLLWSISLSNANISGHIPKWFHDQMEQLSDIDLSNNKLSGFVIFPVNSSSIDFSNNSLSGELLFNGNQIKVYLQLSFIDLSNNFFVGSLPQDLANMMPNLKELFLSNNRFSGPIPKSLCQLTSLSSLDLQYNSLSGKIPNCWANVSRLTFVRLSYNKLQGRIPCFTNTYSGIFGSITGTHFFMHLNDNMLSGEIPSCVSNLTNLKVLDIGGNRISGKMLDWFSADHLKELQILRLRGNKFSGSIPSQICSLPHLQVIDLGRNQFTGVIPPCLSNITVMTTSMAISPGAYSPGTMMMYSPNNATDPFLDYGDDEVIQGIERAYTSTLKYLLDVDLSCNSLVGSIPEDMTKMSGLMSLNLSYNQLSGTIPGNIGDLKSLISLDLSKNKLRGRIPMSLSQIYSLSHLNMSYNNLSGQIPTGNQLQTLPDQPSIYTGNPYLCGDSLPTKCKSKDNGRSDNNEENDDKKEKLERMGMDLVVISGFATGFWSVVGCLVLNTRWRHAFFLRLEDGYNWLYVIVALRLAKLGIYRR